MDSFFNDCLYAWDFLDSTTGEIGGVGFDAGVSVGGYAGVLGSCATASGSNNLTSSLLDVSGGDYLTFNMWISTNGTSAYPQYLYFYNADKTRWFSISLYEPHNNIYINCSGSSSTSTLNNAYLPYYTTTPKAMLTFTIDKVNKTLSGYCNNNKISFAGNETKTISGFDLFGSFDNIWLRAGDLNNGAISCSLLRVWNKKLTQDDINYLYSGGTGRLLTMPDAKSIYEDCFAYYKLDETVGFTIEDATGNGHNANTTPSVAYFTYADGKIESCFRNRAQINSSHIPLGFNASDFSGKTEATVSFWFKNEQMTGYSYADYDCVSIGNFNTGQYNVYIKAHKDNGVYYANQIVAVVNTNYTSYTASYSLPNSNVWWHIVFVYKNDKIYLYVNGSLVSTVNTNAGSSLKSVSEGSSIMTNGNVTFCGCLDEVGFWQRGLSASEIAELYNGGAGLPFESGPTYLVELTDGVGVTDDVETQTNYHVELQDYNYTTDSEDINQDTTISLRDNVSIGDNVKVKVDYKVDVKEDLQTNDSQRVVVYKNGIDSIWTDRQKPTDTMWVNRPKPWIAK